MACDERPHTVINRPCGCCFYCELCTVKAIGLVAPGRLRCGCNAWVEAVDWREPGPPTVQRLRTHGNTATPEGSYTLTAFMERMAAWGDAELAALARHRFHFRALPNNVHCSGLGI